MGVSTILDVVIGVVFVVFVFSVVASGVHELVTWALATRSKQLWRAIGRLLDGEAGPASNPGRAAQVAFGLNGGNDRRPARDAVIEGEPSLKDQLFAHPLVNGLDGTGGSGTRTRIDHIDAGLFSRALVDVVSGGRRLEDTAEFRRAIGHLPVALRQELESVARHAGDTIEELRTDLSGWFDDRMDALTRSYRSRTRWWLFAIGLAVAVAFNVDALDVTNEFYRDEVTRALVVAEAEALAASPTCEPDATGAITEACRDQVSATANALDLPVWWDRSPDAWSPIGWLIAGAAIAQGGPFWYDVLRRLAGFRRTIGG
ncbi:MAG: hypothetical protein AAGA93_09640 [Actinomycetota bacterium]